MNRDEARKTLSRVTGVPVEELHDKTIVDFDMGMITHLSITTMKAIRFRVDVPMTVGELLSQIEE